MIVSDNTATEKLNSPMNLMNRLKKTSSSRSDAMSLFGIGRKKEVSSNGIISVPQPEITGVEHPVKNTSTLFNPFSATQKKESSLATIQEQPATLNDILKNSDSQIKLGLAHDQALDLLHRSLESLSAKLDDVSAAKLPSVITAASKTVESIRRERSEAAKNNKDREVHYHFYTPQQKTIEQYEVIDIAGV